MAVVEATVVGGTVEEGGDVSEVVTRCVAGLGVKAVAVVDLCVVVDAVVPPVGAVVIVAVVVAVDVMEGSDGVVPTAVVGAAVVLFDRVTYEKGVGVGGWDTPRGYS